MKALEHFFSSTHISVSIPYSSHKSSVELEYNTRTSAGCGILRFSKLLSEFADGLYRHQQHYCYQQVTEIIFTARTAIKDTLFKRVTPIFRKRKMELGDTLTRCSYFNICFRILCLFPMGQIAPRTSRNLSSAAQRWPLYQQIWFCTSFGNWRA